MINVMNDESTAEEVGLDDKAEPTKTHMVSLGGREFEMNRLTESKYISMKYQLDRVSREKDPSEALNGMQDIYQHLILPMLTDPKDIRHMNNLMMSGAFELDELFRSLMDASSSDGNREQRRAAVKSSSRRRRSGNRHGR
jgi:hypothetical protein